MKKKSRTRIYVDENCFSIPINALNLMNRNGAIADYLKNTVNCLSLHQVYEETDFEKLKLLPPDLKFKRSPFNTIDVSFQASYQYDNTNHTGYTYYFSDISCQLKKYFQLFQMYRLFILFHS